MSEQLTRSEVIEIVHEEARAIALEAIAHQTIADFPAYFLNGRWLVTYDWLADVQQEARERSRQLEQRIAQLERPWWKRWLSR